VCNSVPDHGVCHVNVMCVHMYMVYRYETSCSLVAFSTVRKNMLSPASEYRYASLNDGDAF